MLDMVKPGQDEFNAQSNNLIRRGCACSEGRTGDGLCFTWQDVPIKTHRLIELALLCPTNEHMVNSAGKHFWGKMEKQCAP